MKSTVLCESEYKPGQIASPHQVTITKARVEEITMLQTTAMCRVEDKAMDVFPIDSRRRIILDLSQVLLKASFQRRDLSPIMFEALYYALEQLLYRDINTSFEVLEEWLVDELGGDLELTARQLTQSEASPAAFGAKSLANPLPTGDREPPVVTAVIQDRRYCERRFGERRIRESDGPAPGEVSGGATDRRRVSDRRSGNDRRQDEIAALARAAGDGLNPQGRNANAVPGGASRLRGAAVSAMLNSALFRSQSLPLSHSYFVHVSPEEAAQDDPGADAPQPRTN